jgi:FKBP-type peptidyl-prolyl cis-trans isomerase 2
MALQKGDFMLINYTAKVKETNKVFDTTVEETAKKEKLQKEGEIYEPRLIVIGEGWMFKGKILKALDESLISMELAKSATVEIPPEKAFGPRDPEKLKRVSIKHLLERDVQNPTIGMSIEYGGKVAIIRSIGAGRVLLDFNEEFAGRTLVYDITIEKKIETNEEKITALIHRRIRMVNPANFKLSIEPNMLTVEMPEEAFYIERIQINKAGIALDIQKYLPEITTVKFVETFKASEKTKPTQTERLSLRCKVCNAEFSSAIGMDRASFESSQMTDIGETCPNGHAIRYNKEDYFFK